MGSPLTVRAMREGDLLNVAALLRGAFDHDLTEYLTYTQAGLPSYLRVALDYPEMSPTKLYLVAVDRDDLAVAYAEYLLGNPGPDVLTYICVHESFRGRGVATALIERCVQLRSGSARVELDVFAHNSGARALYESLGFRQCGEKLWLRRPMPAASFCDTPLAVPSLHEHLAAHGVYGFSGLPVSWRGDLVNLGRIGARVLRCYEPGSFADDELLSRVRCAFPTISEALLITDGPDDGSVCESASPIARSIRMATSSADLQKRTGQDP